MLLGADAGSPVTTGGSTGTDGGHRGCANMTLEEVKKYLGMADAAGVPVLAHANGDAATDMLIEAVRQVRGDRPRPDLRTVIIHAQTMRDDHLVPTRPPATQLQVFIGIQAIDEVLADRPALAPQQDLQATIPIAYPHRR